MNHKKKRLPSGNQTKSIQVNPVFLLLFWQPFRNEKIQMSYKKINVEVMGLFKKRTERSKGEKENRY